MVRNVVNDSPARSVSVGFYFIGIFLFCIAFIAGVAATTLLCPGTFLDRLWALNPRAHQQIGPWRGAFGILVLLIGVSLVIAGIGWFRHRRWGWTLAVVIIGMQAVGDMVNCLRGDWLRGGTGAVIAGALLLVLFRKRIRDQFA